MRESLSRISGRAARLHGSLQLLTLNTDVPSEIYGVGNKLRLNSRRPPLPPQIFQYIHPRAPPLSRSTSSNNSSRVRRAAEGDGMQVGVPEENAQEHRNGQRMQQARLKNFKSRREVDSLKAENDNFKKGTWVAQS